MQFGFRQNFSTSHALINPTENIRQALDEGYSGCSMLVDLKKLLTQCIIKYCYLNLITMVLEVYQITGLNLTSLITSNLFINGYDSGLAEVNCGVPQGSILGPLLFLLYINNLNQVIKCCKVHNFADDANLLYSGKSIEKFNKLVNIDLKNLLYWLSANKISLNVKKTELVIFKSKWKQFDGE